MPVNAALGHLSNAFLIAALVIYTFSVFAFAGDFAFGRPRRAAEARGQQEAHDRAAALATVGAAPAAPAAPVAPVASGAAASETTASQAPEPPEDRGVPAAPGARGPAAGGPADGAMPQLAVPALRAIREAGRLVVAAVLLSSLGVAAHTTAVITRGLAVHRAPWGN